MYTYTKELSSGYLVLPPNVPILLQALSQWESTMKPYTLTPGKSNGRVFASLKRVDTQSILDSLSPGESSYLIGDRSKAHYACITRLTQSRLLALDTSPSLLQFIYEHSNVASPRSLIEGAVLTGIQIIIPSVHLSQANLLSLLSRLKPLVTLYDIEASLFIILIKKHTFSLAIEKQQNPVRTIFTLKHITGKPIWKCKEKSALYKLVNHITHLLQKSLIE